jgi:phosphoglycolate phosphatase
MKSRKFFVKAFRPGAAPPGKIGGSPRRTVAGGVGRGPEPEKWGRVMTVVLFDIDGTLVRSGGAGKLAMEAALAEEFGVRVAAEEVPYSGRTDFAIGRDLLAAHGLDPSAANQARLHDGYLARLPAALAAAAGEVCPGIGPLLAALRGRDRVVLGLLTGNVRRGAERKLGHFGLWDTFAGLGGFGDGHFDRDDVARSAVAAVERHLGRAVDTARVWVVGDTPLDVSCARAVGAKAVAVATGWHPIGDLHAAGADYVLPDLGDHADLLRLWN